MVSKKYEFSDMFIRKYKSMFFRFSIVTYAFILTNIQNNCFHPLLYPTIGLVYLTLYAILSNKKPSYRLVCDSIYILFVIWGKDYTDISVIIFILFPLFNSVNFSGKQKTPYLLFLCTAFIYLIIAYPNVNIHSIILGTFGILLIDRISNLNWKSNILLQKMFDHVDTYFENIGKMHKVYRDVISEVNTYLGHKLIEDIICLTEINRNSFDLVNSSSFIYKYDLEFDTEQTEALNHGKIVKDVQLKIDKKEKSKNLCFLIESTIKEERKKYLFVVTLYETMRLRDVFSDINTSFEALFERIARILHNEKKLREIRQNTIRDLSNKMKFVDQAIATMHFIRNRLSPYKTLIELIELKENENTGKEINQWDNLIFKSSKTAKNELNRIINKANYLLEKDNNPFENISQETYSFNHIFDIIRSIWIESFSSSQLIVSENIIENNDLFEININKECLEILLSDWIRNMAKYQKEYSNCTIDVINQEMIITFKNDFIDIESTRQLVKDINSNDRQQIIRRKTHGLYFIKEMLENLKIGYKSSIKNENDKNLLLLSLNIKSRNTF